METILIKTYIYVSFATRQSGRVSTKHSTENLNALKMIFYTHTRRRKIVNLTEIIANYIFLLF